MSIAQKVLASSLGVTTAFKTKDNVSIVIVTGDNKSFCINLVGNNQVQEGGHLPNSVILTEKPIDNFKVICRLVTEEKYSLNMFNTNKYRVIANSLEDKLKSFAILKELRNCI